LFVLFGFVVCHQQQAASDICFQVPKTWAYYFPDALLGAEFASVGGCMAQSVLHRRGLQITVSNPPDQSLWHNNLHACFTNPQARSRLLFF
jgi:hypothetical protein